MTIKKLINDLSITKNYSRIISIATEELYEFIRDYDIDCSVKFKILNYFLIPELTIYVRMDQNNKDEILKLINLIDSKFNWQFSSAAIYDDNPNNINLSKSKFTQYTKLSSFLNSINFYRLVAISIRPKSLTNAQMDSDMLVDDLFNKSEVYLFHVTDESNLSSILNKGLVPSDSIINNFKYINQLHLLRSLNGNIVRLINNNLVITKNLGIKNPVLLKVGPINNLDFDLFIDPASPEDGLVTSSTIDSKYISVVPKSEYKSIFDDYDISKLKFIYKPIYLDRLDGVKYDESIRSLRSFSIKYDREL